jgi:hypothetical protein
MPCSSIKMRAQYMRVPFEGTLSADIFCHLMTFLGILYIWIFSVQELTTRIYRIFWTST